MREQTKLETEIDSKSYIRQSACLCPWRLNPYHTFLQPSNARELGLSLVKMEGNENQYNLLLILQQNCFQLPQI